MKQEMSSGWQIMWWLFKLFGFPVTIPWLLYRLFDAVQHKRQKDTLGGKVVLITGASSGLGEALAHVFYNCGCRLILLSRRKDELERVKHALMSMHQTVPTHPPVILPFDLADINSLSSEMSKLMAIHERIDILVNNAGISYRGEVATTNMDVDIKVMLINYFAQIALTKALLPFMLKQRSGHIVYISSVQGKIAIPYRSAYAASKHALQAWCDAARAELVSQNIKITIVNPGYVQTSLSVNALTGSGQTYGVMDQTTKNGYTPKYVAERILKAVLKQEKEVTIATFMPRCAIFLRTICPVLFFWVMKRRARRMFKEE